MPAPSGLHGSARCSRAGATAGGRTEMRGNILLPDSTWVGSLFDRGQDPPGVGHVIVGGGGAFTGVIGEHRLMESLAPARAVSQSEDPSMRRIHGGGRSRLRFILYLRSRPTVQADANGPAIFHEDLSQVTAAWIPGPEAAIPVR